MTTVIINGNTYTFPDDFENYGYIENFPAIIADVGAVATQVQAAATQGGYTTTSSSSVAVGTGAKTFTVESGKAFIAGQLVLVADTAAPTTNYMIGTVTSYSSTTLIINSAITGGSGTINSWAISIKTGNVTGPTSAPTQYDLAGFADTTGQTLVAIGASNRTQALAALTVSGRRSLAAYAGHIVPSASGGCGGAAQIATSANHPDIIGLPFDWSTQEYAQFYVQVPKQWDEGTITAQFVWLHNSAASDNRVVWSLQGVAVSDDDTLDVAYGTAQQIADGASSGGTAKDVYKTAETPAITIAGTPQAEDLLCFRASRVTGDAADTMSVDAYLIAVVLHFNCSQGNDA